MANIVFSNNTSGLHELFYDSHAQLLRMVALDLGAEDKIDYLQEKFLGKKLKLKKQKNPHAPKKPKSSYFFFCDEHRSALIEKHKKKNKGKKQDKSMMGLVAKELGKMWKELKSKDKYNKMSVDDKKRYEKEMNTFNEKYG
tara:strand:- start:19 stop:441 length:423 start_codon:yes stop_codon:yes gene_type:complete